MREAYIPKISARNLKVGFTNIDVAFDQEKEVLHILDNDYPSTMTVTNAVDSGYIERVLDSIGVVTEPKKVFLYHTDGYISTWTEDRGFKPVDYENLETYTSFWKRAKARKEELEDRRFGKYDL
jgi:hypothetical protein